LALVRGAPRAAAEPAFRETAASRTFIKRRIVLVARKP